MSLINLHLLARIVFLTGTGLYLLTRPSERPGDWFRIPAGLAAIVLAVLAVIGQ